jgi:hypothetical protein
MRVRHIVRLLAVLLSLSALLVGCGLLGTTVTIDERITDFQTDLNKTDRTSAYLNFHPSLTKDYDALKDGATITSLFPVPDGTGSDYALSITDKANPGTTGVLVTVTGGPTSYLGTHHLILVMDVEGLADYRIVSLSMDDGAGNYPSTPQIQ